MSVQRLYLGKGAQGTGEQLPVLLRVGFGFTFKAQTQNGLGVTGAASTVTLEECDDFTPSNNTAIGFDYYAETTAGGDTLGTKLTATSAGFATSTNDGVFYVIEISAAELSAGYPNLRVVFSDPSASTLASVMVVLSGARYQSASTPTARAIRS